MSVGIRTAVIFVSRCIGVLIICFFSRLLLTDFCVCVAGEGVAQPVWAVQVEPIFAMHWCMWVHTCTFLFVANDISQKAMSAVCNICNADLPC